MKARLAGRVIVEIRQRQNLHMLVEFLTQMGFLSDGEMHFFTREPQASPHDIFDMVLGSMYERILK